MQPTTPTAHYNHLAQGLIERGADSIWFRLWCMRRRSTPDHAQIRRKLLQIHSDDAANDFYLQSLSQYTRSTSRGGVTQSLNIPVSENLQVCVCVCVCVRARADLYTHEYMNEKEIVLCNKAL